MADQTFKATISLTTDCEEILTEDEFKEWVYEQFEGCDLGEVTMVTVREGS